MHGSAKWPKSYVIHIDGWAVTLLIVGFLPWLRTVFESMDFPSATPATSSSRLASKI
jgi:hypothetical protein